MKKSDLKKSIKELIVAELAGASLMDNELNEGVWSVLPDRIPEFIQAVNDLKDEYHSVVGSDDVFDGLDAAISAAENLMSLNKAEDKNKQYYKNVALLNKKGLAKKQFSDEDIQIANKMLSQSQFKLDEAEDDEDFDEDKAEKQAQKAAKKGDSISKLASKLAETVKEMKSLVKKYKQAEGAEKEKVKDRLKELTKIKKEIEASINKEEEEEAID